MTGFIGLFDTARDYTLQITITHTQVPTVTSLLLLFGSGFHQRTIPLPLSSQTVHGLSFQLLTGTAHNY
jgi:hypothetical protein